MFGISIEGLLLIVFLVIVPIIALIKFGGVGERKPGKPPARGTVFHIKDAAGNDRQAMFIDGDPPRNGNGNGK